MLPVIALVGRPNVGKSTLFNRLTKTRDAIVHDQPGVTRDRLYGKGVFDDKNFLVIDTGGVGADSYFDAAIREQVEQAVQESAAVLFLVDARAGLTPADISIANQLRANDARVCVVVNKSESQGELASAEFQKLGLGAPHAISALNGGGVYELMQFVLRGVGGVDAGADDALPTIALAGRPNVGKSTLVNKLTKSARVLVSDTPGTTRDSVRISLQFEGREVQLIDTAGVRRRARVVGTLEKFSVVKTLQAMEAANVVVLLLDATCEIGAQDSTIAGMVLDLGRSLVVVVNKWDGLAEQQKKKIRAEIKRKLSFLPQCDILFISALHGTNIDGVLPAALRAYQCAMIEIATSSLNKTLAAAVMQTPPPMRSGRAVRLKFAHQAGKNPPLIIIHGTRVNKLPRNYRKYLANYFARAYRLQGTGFRILLRAGDNPYLKK